MAEIAFHNKAAVYAILFRAAAQTLCTIAADPRHLGAEIGVVAVLHTWGQNLRRHPHVHCVVPGGGLSLDGTRWVACRPGFFLPVRVLSCSRALATLPAAVPGAAPGSIRCRGPTGVGKSWLACALGNKACRDNHPVLYQRVPKLFPDLALARGDGRYPRLMKRLGKVTLLILDDWGLEPFGPDQRRDLLEIVEERCGRSATVPPSSPARSPSTAGTTSSANPPSPTPSSTASSTMPIASSSRATRCAESSLLSSPPLDLDVMSPV